MELTRTDADERIVFSFIQREIVNRAPYGEDRTLEYESPAR